MAGLVPVGNAYAEQRPLLHSLDHFALVAPEPKAVRATCTTNCIPEHLCMNTGSELGSITTSFVRALGGSGGSPGSAPKISTREFHRPRVEITWY